MAQNSTTKPSPGYFFDLVSHLFGPGHSTGPHSRLYERYVIHIGVGPNRSGMGVCLENQRRSHVGGTRPPLDGCRPVREDRS